MHLDLSLLDPIVKILQVGFAGFVFLLAYLSYDLLKTEQAREGPPRPQIIKELRSFRKWAILLSLLVLVAVAFQLWMKTWFCGEICIVRDKTLSRTKPVSIPIDSHIVLELISTTTGTGRGATIRISGQDNFFPEKTPQSQIFGDREYFVTVKNVAENSAEISICRCDLGQH